MVHERIPTKLGRISTLPETNSSHLKIDGWFRCFISFGALCLFSGANLLLVSGEGIFPQICASKNQREKSIRSIPSLYLCARLSFFVKGQLGVPLTYVCYLVFSRDFLEIIAHK